jgi:hypothetical protein
VEKSLRLFSEYPKENAEFSFAGEGMFGVKIPTKPFFKTVSNALDSLHDMMEKYRSKLGECARVEQDVRSCTKLVEYRTRTGIRKAYFVMSGVLKSQLARRDREDRREQLARQGKNEIQRGEVQRILPTPVRCL